MKLNTALLAYIAQVDAAKPGYHAMDTSRWNSPEMRLVRFCCSHGYRAEDCASTIKFSARNGYEPSVTPARAAEISPVLLHLHGVLAAFYYIQ